MQKAGTIVSGAVPAYHGAHLTVARVRAFASEQLWQLTSIACGRIGPTEELRRRHCPR